RGIDLVDANAAFSCSGDRRIQALQELVEGFAGTPLEHGVAVVVVVRDGGAGDGAQLTDADLTAVVDQLSDVGKRKVRRAHAASRSSIRASSSTRHGSISSTRLIGCSAMRSMTWRRYACGSRPLSLAVPIRL